MQPDARDAEHDAPGAQRVLILGATSAIAAECARLYAARGARLYVVGRDPTKLAGLVAELGPACVGRAQLDFASQAQLAESTIDAAAEALGGLDIALIAHGLLGDQLRSERDLDHADEILDVNYRSVVALLIPLANRCEAQGHGQIAVLGSVAGDRGRPRNYSYGATKRALGIYLEGVRSRLYHSKIGVHEVRLGPVDTPMTVDHPKTAVFATQNAAARGILRAIDRRKRCAYVPGFWRPIMFAVRHMPEALFQRFDFLSGR